MKTYRKTLTVFSLLFSACALLFSPLASAMPLPVDGVYAERSTAPSDDPAMLSAHDTFVLVSFERSDNALAVAYWREREALPKFDIAQEIVLRLAAQTALKRSFEPAIWPEYGQAFAAKT